MPDQPRIAEKAYSQGGAQSFSTNTISDGLNSSSFVTPA